MADHPPAGPVTIVTHREMPINDMPPWLSGHQYWLIFSGWSSKPDRARLTIEWSSGRIDRIPLSPVESGDFEYISENPTEPARYIIHAKNSRSRWNHVVWQVVPIIEHIDLAIRHADRVYPLEPSTREPIRVAVGSELLIEVTASPDAARLTHPDAVGNALTVPVEPGVQSIELELTLPDGTPSRHGRTIELVGLSQAEVDTINAELVGGEWSDEAIGLPVAADALAGAVAFGSPDQATAADLASGTPTDDPPTGDEPDDNGAGTTGEGRGGNGATTDTPRLVDAVGVLAERYQVTGDDLQQLRRLVDTAPPGYRDLVAEYLLKLRENP